MKYHEIGERFEYDGVAFEVMQYRGNQIPCMDCYFRHFRIEDFDCGNTLCRCNERKDGKDVYYKLIEQCKQKDMEQKTEFMVAGTDKVFATHVINELKIEDLKNGDFVAFDYNGNNIYGNQYHYLYLLLLQAQLHHTRISLLFRGIPLLTSFR